MAEDVVQEAWTRLIMMAQSRAPDEPVAYLYRIVRNLAVDGQRRHAFEQRHFIREADDLATQTATDAPSPEAFALSSDELRLAMEVMQSFPEPMRIAVEMHRIGGARLKDIAVRLGISVTSAHALVSEGVQRCRERLRRDG